MGLKLGGARVPAGEPQSQISTIHPGTRLLKTPDELISWYRSGGDQSATKEMTEMLHGLVPGLVPHDICSDACCCPRTTTGLPYIGPLKRGWFVVTGGNGLAAKSSDEIGRLAASAALPQDVRRLDAVLVWGEDDLNLLSADRFKPLLR